jgi:hypothetical protein
MEHVTTEQTRGGTGQGIRNSGHERYKVESNDKGLREQRDEFQGKVGRPTLIAVFSVSPEKQWETTRLQTRIAGLSTELLCLHS